MAYAMGYLRLSKPEILINIENESQVKMYEVSTLSPEMSERYLNKLLHAMESEQLFTDGELTLQRLAEKLSIPAQHLSQVINERRSQSFSDLINTYRVEAAKKKLVDPKMQHYTVLAIAEDVGFNSKSSFNAVFKKHTNMTPSEFRKSSNGNGAQQS